ncbi:Protein of unknown function [Desulfonatronum zhilinae]|nr:Protein of unknown function [Desulfonatronum zhilinae]
MPKFRRGPLILLAVLFFHHLCSASALSAAGADALLASTAQGDAREVLIFSEPSEPSGPGERTPAGNDSRVWPKAFDLSGFMELKTALDTQRSDTFEHDRMLRHRIRLEGRWTPGRHLSERAGRPSESSLFFLASLQSDYLWFGPDNTTEDYDLDLFEGFMHWAKAPWEVRLGRQRVRWGKTDEISPVDNLNPQDLREFLLPPREDRKIPNWMARVRFFPDWFTVEGVYVPFFESSRLDYFDTDWAMFRHLKEDARSSNLPEPMSEYLSALSVNENTPSRRATNGDWGARVSKSISGWDLAASYLYAWEKIPHISSFPVKGLHVEGGLSPESITTAARNAWLTRENIEVVFKRSHTLGLEFETTLDQFGFRGEAAYSARRSLLTDSLVSTSKPVLHYVLGVDHLGEQDWYVNVQFGHQVVFGHDSTILFQGRNEYSINGELNKEFQRGNLKAVLRYHYGITDQSFFVNPHVILRFIKNWEFTLGLDLLGGPGDTIPGQYRDNDQVYILARFFF